MIKEPYINTEIIATKEFSKVGDSSRDSKETYQQGMQKADKPEIIDLTGTGKTTGDLKNLESIEGIKIIRDSSGIRLAVKQDGETWYTSPLTKST